MMNTDVKLAYETIRAKSDQHTTAFAYYDGVQPLIYANTRLREVFSGENIRFTQNWCGVVIDAVKERLQISGFEGPESAAESLSSLWEDNQLGLLTDDVHEAALITGEAYVIVWADEDAGVEIYYNDPRLCHMFYDPLHPRNPRMAAKLWVDETDECYRLILYYADRLEYYRTKQKADSVSTWSAFFPDDTEYPGGIAVNPHGRIPVFRFLLRHRYLRGDLYDVIPMQDGINKLLTDMMVAAEFGAFRQRWVISNADVAALKNAPNEIWQIPAGDGIGQSTQVGEFNPTDLSNYLEAIENLAATISKITRMPQHYFYARGGYPSGEALVAMEAPLKFKVSDRAERFEPVWKDLMAFALTLAGTTVLDKDLTVDWKPVQTIQPETEAKIRLLDVQAGIPLETSLKRSGWTDAEIEDMQQMAQTGGEQLGTTLLAAFDRDQAV